MLSQKFAPSMHGRKLAVGDVLKTFGSQPSGTYSVEAFDTTQGVYLRSRADGRCDWYTAFCLPRWFCQVAAKGGTN